MAGHHGRRRKRRKDNKGSATKTPRPKGRRGRRK